MPICPKCRTGYDEPAENCPKCGTQKPPLGQQTNTRSFGKLQYFCLHFAYFAMFLSAILLLISGISSLVKGKVWEGLGAIVIAAPTTYGITLALGLAIEYADRQRPSGE